MVIVQQVQQQTARHAVVATAAMDAVTIRILLTHLIPHLQTVPEVVSVVVDNQGV